MQFRGLFNRFLPIVSSFMHPKNSCFQPTIKMVGFPAGKS